MRNNLALPARQRGMTLIGWAAVLAILVFIAMFFIRLTPVYIEYFSVKSSIDSLATDSRSGGLTVTGGALGAKELRQILMRRFDINSVRRVEAEDIIVERQGAGYLVSVEYEAVTNFFGNIRLLVEFSHAVEVPIS